MRLDYYWNSLSIRAYTARLLWPANKNSGSLLHIYCTSTYTEVTVLLLRRSSNATLEYPYRYSNRVAVWVLHGNSRVISQEQHGYFSVGTNAVTVWVTTSPAIVILLCTHGDIPRGGATCIRRWISCSSTKTRKKDRFSRRGKCRAARV